MEATERSQEQQGRRPVGEVLASLAANAIQYLGELFDDRKYYQELMRQQGGYKATLHVSGGEEFSFRIGGAPKKTNLIR